jgi:hypothetical protein
MVATPVLAPSLPGWDDVDVVPDALIEQLYRSGESGAAELTAALSPQQRAALAVYCYRRSHLHRIGLAIAATCDQFALTRILGTALGSALFVQSRETRGDEVRAPAGPRPKVTLAKSPPLRPAMPAEAWTVFQAADDPPDDGG